MGKYSRGAQLGNNQRSAGREQRQRQIAERNKAQRAEKTRFFAKKAMIVLAVLVLLLIAYDRQFVRYSEDSIDEAYKSSVDEYFSGNPLRKSKIFFSSEDFKNYIISKHPEVSDVTVGSSVLTDAKIVISQRQPSFIWQSNNKTYIGGEDGVIYDEQSAGQTSDQPVLRDQAGISTKPGDKVITSGTLEYVNQVKDAISSNTQLAVDYIVIPAAAREVHVYIKGKPYFVKFSLDRSVEGQVSELDKSIDYITASKIGVAKYIDLRTEDKAYYQ